MARRLLLPTLVCLLAAALTSALFLDEGSGSGDDTVTRGRPADTTTANPYNSRSWCSCTIYAGDKDTRYFYRTPLKYLVGSSANPISLEYTKGVEGCNDVTDRCAEYCRKLGKSSLTSGPETMLSARFDQTLGDYMCQKTRTPVGRSQALKIVSTISCGTYHFRYETAMVITDAHCCSYGYKQEQCTTEEFGSGVGSGDDVTRGRPVVTIPPLTSGTKCYCYMDAGREGTRNHYRSPLSSFLGQEGSYLRMSYNYGVDGCKEVGDRCTERCRNLAQKSFSLGTATQLKTGPLGDYLCAKTRSSASPQTASIVSYVSCRWSHKRYDTALKLTDSLCCGRPDGRYKQEGCEPFDPNVIG